MPETSGIRAERPTTPERPAFAREHVGLRARLLVHGSLGRAALDRTKPIETITPDSLGNFAGRDYALFENKSIEERRAHQRAKYPEQQFDQVYQTWRSNTAKTLAHEKSQPKRDQLKRLSTVLAEHGIDFEQFKPESVDALYDRYFRSAQSEGVKPTAKSQVKTFVGDVLKAYTDKQTGKVDQAALETDLGGIQWLAKIFGVKYSNEITAQLAAGEAGVVSDPERVIAEATEKAADGSLRVNEPNLLAREREVLDFLAGGVVDERQADEKKVDEPVEDTVEPVEEDQQSAEDEPLAEDVIDTYVKYLSYGDVDVREITRQGLIAELNESESAQRYAKELESMMEEYGEQALTEEAKRAVASIQEMTSELGVVATLYSNSQSWFLWHAAKSRFLAKNPEIQAKMPNAGRYEPFDPLLYTKEGVSTEDADRSRKARDEIIRTHLGWEIYANQPSFESLMGRLDPVTPVDIKKEIEGLLLEDPDNGDTLSSYKLRRLGELVWAYRKKSTPTDS